jgi:pimeloyl-ACP methyl ester carboxylesterase
MAEAATQFIEVGEGVSARRIAVIAEEGDDPTLLWLGGFKSDMTATKASALAAWARAHGRAMLRLDYSGHGQSEGSFESGTVTRWLEEAEAVVRRFAAGSLVIVGSSMGGWISLLLARRLTQLGQSGRMRGIVLIAPAVDMTEVLVWAGMSEADRTALLREGRVAQPTQYGPEPYVITRTLIEDGRKHLVGAGPIALPCPVRILHGQRDPDVPWRLSLELTERLDAPSVHLTLVKDGDHRLSRPEDIALLLATVAGV